MNDGSLMSNGYIHAYGAYDDPFSLPDITLLFLQLQQHPNAHQKGMSYSVSRRFCVFHPFNNIDEGNPITRIVVKKVFSSNASPLLLSLEAEASFKTTAVTRTRADGDDPVQTTRNATNIVPTCHNHLSDEQGRPQATTILGFLNEARARKTQWDEEDKIRLSNRCAMNQSEAPRNGTSDDSPDVPPEAPSWSSLSSSLVIFKCGDDLRIDMSVMQLFGLMNHLWSQEKLYYAGLPVHTRTYGVLALSPNMGLIQFIESCVPLKDIEERSHPWSLDCKHMMISTAAGAYVAGYVLGIRDRHFDNILVAADGSIFHIDFSYVLGQGASLETSEFAITPGFKKVLGGLWTCFVDTCESAFKVLRDNSRMVIGLADIVFKPFPEHLKYVYPRLSKALLLENTTDEEARVKVRKLINEAPGNLKTKFKNVIHGLTRDLN